MDNLGKCPVYRDMSYFSITKENHFHVTQVNVGISGSLRIFSVSLTENKQKNSPSMNNA